MKTSLKRLVTGLSALGLSLSVGLPSIAQTTPSPVPPSNRDYGIPPIRGGQPGQNTPGTTTAPDNSNPGGTTTIPSVPNNQSVPGVVAPANRPETNNLPGTTSTPGSTSTTPTAPVSFAGSENQTIDQIVRVSPSFELFNALLRVAESNGALPNTLTSGTYTVFAPTDEALAALPPATFKALVQPENRDLLVRVLENHIVAGRVSSADLAAKQVRSLGGNAIAAQGGTGALTVGNAQVIGADIQASNGIIHAINGVILPADLQSRLTSLAPQAGVVQP
ncbi:fasciclin domain-containing protein [Pseudanabaenaceae cyanobacterium LEGE 13415]|nr:fasciclin domain-containing protein [Pseudanabaenaceae cyanobacterium LEGE 13415]